jgi:plastocyanin
MRSRLLVLVPAAWLLVRLPAAAAPATGRIAGAVDPSLTDDPASAFVYVEEIAGRTFPPPAEPAVMEQQHLQFVPHVLPVVRGTTVRFPNGDRVRHNVFSPSPAKPFNFGIYLPREERQLTFDTLGTVTLLCNIHEQMSAYIVVLQNPYFARLGPDGRYAIDDVPAGRYTLALWTERGARPKQPVVVARGSTVNTRF